MDPLSTNTPLTREPLYEFTTSLLDGLEMDITLFYSLLDIAQSNRENARPWVILRSVDSSQTCSASNTVTTPKDLPSDFKKTYARFGIVLTDSQGNVVRRLREVPLNFANEYRNDNGKFYINYATGKFHICGTHSQSSTINLYYIKKCSKISKLETNTWPFDNYDDSYSKILGLDVAVMHKWGIDYDQINSVQADKNFMQAEIIFKNMAEWDSTLAQQAQEGVDYGGGNGQSYTELSGSTSSLI